MNLFFFIDAVHPTQATEISYGWIRKGHLKAIQTKNIMQADAFNCYDRLFRVDVVVNKNWPRL